jgi:maltooligosyltrehalose trehalohydrolase
MPCAPVRRAEFASHGWSTADVPDPQNPATREASVLAWGEVDEAGHRRLLDWYRACIALRRRVIGVGPTRLADVRVDVDEAARTVVTLHAPAGRTASAVVVNLADDPADVPLPRRVGGWPSPGTPTGAPRHDRRMPCACRAGQPRCVLW